MTHAVVTVEIDSRTHVDLALPLNIPSRVLANAVAQALEVDKDGKKQYSLAVKTERGLVGIPPQSTLGDLKVLDGFRLQLSDEKNVPPPLREKARLETEKGKAFLLDSHTILIGRMDIKHGGVVDIDLAPLDPTKIVSRKHAIIELQKGHWVLIEQKSVRNGTWLNGHKLDAEEPYTLQDGDEVIFGRNGVILKFFMGK